MSEGPISGDREQQRRDNVASRRQSGLEPLPRDRKEQEADREAKTREAEDEARRAVEGAQGDEAAETGQA